MPVSLLWLPRGEACVSGWEGRSLQPARVVGWSSLPLERPARGPGHRAILVAADTALFSVPLSSSALPGQQGLTAALLEAEKRSVFTPSLSLSRVCSHLVVFVCPYWGERKTETLLPVIGSAASLSGSGGSFGLSWGLM